MRNDDDAWVDALAGRACPDIDPVTEREAHLLREATRAWTPREAFDAQPADLASLRARAVEAGLLKPRRAGWALLWGWCAACAERWRRLRERLPGVPAPALGLGFAVLMVAVVLGVLPPTSDPALETQPVLRGSPAEGLALLRDAEPAALRDRIAAELAEAGAAVHRYERLGRFGLDAQLRVPPAEGEAAVLARYKLRQAEDGGLQLEVERSGP